VGSTPEPGLGGLYPLGMRLEPALDWSPPHHWSRVTVIDSHAAGEPFRIVVDGLPDIPGETVLQRRRFASENLDHLRRILMWEPRGHADMYGAWIGGPTSPDSDISVLFIHNAGFSTMCGHGIIALTKVALDTGILVVDGPETTIRIDTPAGQVTSTATMEGDTVASVSFRNVPSFTVEMDAKVDVPGLGRVNYDLAFGGAFYAYVDSASVGVGLSDAGKLAEIGRSIKNAISESTVISHPVEDDLGFLYGVIFTGPPGDSAHHSRQVCVFADGEVDRSPTGTGVSGRLAILHDRGQLKIGRPVIVESIVGSVFTGRIVGRATVGGQEAVIPEIAGTAHITGRSEFWIDPDDTIGEGFLLR
jgi:proline racemase